jgi:hypothetical protein
VRGLNTDQAPRIAVASLVSARQRAVRISVFIMTATVSFREPFESTFTIPICGSQSPYHIPFDAKPRGQKKDSGLT